MERYSALRNEILMDHSSPELQSMLSGGSKSTACFGSFNMTSKETQPETRINSVIVRVEMEVTVQG